MHDPHTPGLLTTAGDRVTSSSHGYLQNLSETASDGGLFLSVSNSYFQFALRGLLRVITLILRGSSLLDSDGKLHNSEYPY